MAVAGLPSHTQGQSQPRTNCMIAALTSCVRQCQFATSSRGASSVQTCATAGTRARRKCYVAKCFAESRDAGAIPAATFSAQASIGDSTRHSTSKPPDNPGVASHDGGAVFRQEATASGGSRPPRATESDTGAIIGGPDLASVVAAWPDLPDSVRVAIVAMVSACEDSENSK